MSVMVTVEFNLKPESAEGFLEAMKATLPDTRGFKGCQDVKSYYESETHSLFLVELWDSADDQQAYLKWRAEGGMMEAIGGAITGPTCVPDVRNPRRYLNRNTHHSVALQADSSCLAAANAQCRHAFFGITLFHLCQKCCHDARSAGSDR